jgi:hypothetical protein
MPSIVLLVVTPVPRTTRSKTTKMLRVGVFDLQSQIVLKWPKGMIAGFQPLESDTGG